MHKWSSYKQALFTLGLIILLASAVRAQAYKEKGNIPIRNFTTKEFAGTAINNFIIEDLQGVIYVANNVGVLTYDGLRWSTIRILDDAKVFSLGINTNGVIFVGGHDQLGYLWPNSIGELKYKSLVERLPKADQSFGRIQKIVSYAGNVYFHTNKKRVLVLSGETLKTIDLDGLSNMFLVEDKLYMLQEGSGFVTLEDTSKQMVLNKELLEGMKLQSMLQLNKTQILLISEKKGLFILNNEREAGYKLAKFQTELDQFFRGKTIRNGILLKNGNISIGTKEQGIIVLDQWGRLVQFVNKESTLQNMTIHHQYQDSHGSLWLALRNGISKLDISSPIVNFLKDRKLEGTIETIERCNGYLYVGSDQGLYLLDNEQVLESDGSSYNYSDLRKILNAECWDLLSFKIKNEELLLVAASEGIFQVDNNQNIKKISSYDPNVLYQSKKDSARVFLGLYPGFASIYYINEIWKDEGKVEAVKDRIYRIVMDEDGTYWLGNDHPPNGTANLTMNRYNSQLASIQIASYDTSSGLPKQNVYPVKVLERVLFATGKGLYSFNKENKTFSPFMKFGKQFADGTLNTHLVEVDETGNVWMCTLNGLEEVDLGYAWLDQQGQYHWENKPFRGITEGVIMDFLHETNGITWLGGTHGLFRYDAFVKTDYNKDFSAIIRQVIVGREVVIFGGSYLDKEGAIVYAQPDNMKPELKYAKNSISFQFSAHSYEGPTVNTFSYRLDGFENEWTPFKPEATAKFTNLHEGKYSFRVRGQNLYGHESKEAVYEFTILPPWYRTIWTYIIYVLLFVGLIYMIVRVSIYRLNAAKIQLEKVVAERTAEVVKQKEEIAQKNQDITASIRYAERIQSSLLPSSEELSILPDGFVLFQPKDIVSGDFYWMQHHNDRIYLAACDCTGHGVPGAFMSMIGSSFLDEAVVEKGITQPNEIFFEVRKGFIKALKQTGEKGQQKDGMDATLIAWDKKTALQVASAFNPVLIIRKGEIEELKPDRQPVGFHTGEQKPFTHHELKLDKGDTVYIFSDGYHDQFGGPKDKKFMMKNFKKLLLSIQDKTMNEQKAILETTMAEWIGDTEQVDDILVMGVRF